MQRNKTHSAVKLRPLVLYELIELFVGDVRRFLKLLNLFQTVLGPVLSILQFGFLVGIICLEHKRKRETQIAQCHDIVRIGFHGFFPGRNSLVAVPKLLVRCHLNLVGLVLEIGTGILLNKRLGKLDALIRVLLASHTLENVILLAALPGRLFLSSSRLGSLRRLCRWQRDCGRGHNLGARADCWESQNGQRAQNHYKAHLLVHRGDTSS